MAWVMAQDISEETTADLETLDLETWASEIAGEAMVPVGFLRAVRLADQAVSASGLRCFTVDEKGESLFQSWICFQLALSNKCQFIAS